jgi:large subunit ribosomal protein L13
MQTTTQTHTIDANGKRIGRVATEAARVLRGKESTAYAPNRTPDVTVQITNASYVDIPERKYRTETYVSYSGYPSGKKVQTLGDLIEKKGHAEAVRRAVYGMLPNNRLRKKLMKQLTIEE